MREVEYLLAKCVFLLVFQLYSADEESGERPGAPSPVGPCGLCLWEGRRPPSLHQGANIEGNQALCLRETKPSRKASLNIEGVWIRGWVSCHRHHRACLPESCALPPPRVGKPQHARGGVLAENMCLPVTRRVDKGRVPHHQSAPAGCACGKDAVRLGSFEPCFGRGNQPGVASPCSCCTLSTSSSRRRIRGWVSCHWHHRAFLRPPSTSGPTLKLGERGWYR